MRHREIHSFTRTLIILVTLGLASSGAPSAQPAPEQRPMSILDVQQMRSVDSPDAES